jgi:hypothetical protein
MLSWVTNESDDSAGPTSVREKPRETASACSRGFVDEHDGVIPEHGGRVRVGIENGEPVLERLGADASAAASSPSPASGRHTLGMRVSA